MDAEQSRITEATEDIEGLDSELSELDYQIVIASDEEEAELEYQFKRLNSQRNEKWNALKDEGITDIVWDDDSIYIRKDNNPYLKRENGQWEAWTYQLPLIR